MEGGNLHSRLFLPPPLFLNEALSEKNEKMVPENADCPRKMKDCFRKMRK